MTEEERNEELKKLINEIAESYEEPDETQVQNLRRLTGVDWEAEDIQMLCCGYWEAPYTLDELVWYLVHENWPERNAGRGGHADGL